MGACGVAGNAASRPKMFQKKLQFQFSKKLKVFLDAT
jgi:hypothetical protein